MTSKEALIDTYRETQIAVYHIVAEDSHLYRW